jgi:hypothetical protein
LVSPCIEMRAPHVHRKVTLAQMIAPVFFVCFAIIINKYLGPAAMAQPPLAMTLDGWDSPHAIWRAPNNYTSTDLTEKIHKFNAAYTSLFEHDSHVDLSTITAYNNRCVCADRGSGKSTVTTYSMNILSVTTRKQLAVCTPTTADSMPTTISCWEVRSVWCKGPAKCDFPPSARMYTRPPRAPHAPPCDYQLRECKFGTYDFQCQDVNIMFNNQPFHMPGVAVNYALNAYAIITCHCLNVFAVNCVIWHICTT